MQFIINHLRISKAKTKKILKQFLFIFGCLLLFVFNLISGYIIHYNIKHQYVVLPNVYINSFNASGLSEAEIIEYWLKQNTPFLNATFTLEDDSRQYIATLSGNQLDIGYDATLSAKQAYLIGRSGNLTTDFLIKFSNQKTTLKPFFRFNDEILSSLLASISANIDVPAQNALFTFENGKVTAFKPSKPGKKLNQTKIINEFNKQLEIIDQTHETAIKINLTVDDINPETTTDQVNSFGIKEQIGHGHSVFPGSIPGRIHNVTLAASKFNGVMIAPGETLSFNKTLGDVSASTGYQPAYIIQNGRTVLGDGGGVCQVSTTLFRAALNTGLPVDERHAHAYRVHYYEDGGYKPGLDATVFDPSADFKITNNTGHHILIQTQIDLKKLELDFYLYGTSDGRKSEIYNFRLWDVTPPPAAVYQDDPTLKKGVVKQVDWSAWGAKAAFNYKVKRGDEILEDTEFLSVYRPWQAIFLKGTME